VSVLFDGTQDRMSLASAPTSIATLTTIIAWIKPAAFASRDTIFAQYNTGSDGYHGLYTFTGGKLRFKSFWSGSNPTWETPASSIASGSWQAVAVTYDASSTANDPIFYRKPEGGAFQTLSLTEVVAPSGALNPSVSQAWIGGVATSYPFNGRIAYVRRFDTILNATQVEDEMDAGAAILTAAFDLPLISDLNDDSGNGHNGTLGGDAVLDADNPTLAGGSTAYTQAVSGAASNSGDLTTISVFINSLVGASTNSGTVNAVLNPISPTAYTKSVSGASTNSGAVFTVKNPVVGDSGFPMRFLQPRTE
jgi:hypothetical protein